MASRPGTGKPRHRRAGCFGAGLALVLSLRSAQAQPASPPGPPTPTSPEIQEVVQPSLEGRIPYHVDRRRDVEPVPEVAEVDPSTLAQVGLAMRVQVGNEGLIRGLELQPRIFLGRRAGGLRSAWDSGEMCPPQALRVGGQWEPEAGATDLLLRRFGDLSDPELQLHYQRRGCVYYHDLMRASGGQRFFLHRYFYYFPLGVGAWGENLAPHVVWVELWERLDPGEVERARWVSRAREEIQEHRAALVRSGAASPEVLARVDGLLEGDLNPPLHMAIQRVVISDPMPVRGEVPWKLRSYSWEDLDFQAGRLVLYVSEGNHRFVPRLARLRWWEECDGPFFEEPHDGKLPLIDLRTPGNPDNPVWVRSQGQAVPVLPGFLDTPAILKGFEQAAWEDPESFPDHPFGPVPERKRRVPGPAHAVGASVPSTAPSTQAAPR